MSAHIFIGLLHNRTDIKQYEHGYVIRTLTRHLTKKSHFITSPASKSDKAIDGQIVSGSNETSTTTTTRSKMRFRRQVTCADPTSYKARGDSIDYFPANSKSRSESASSKAMSPQLSNSLDTINSQLSSIKTALALLERDQGTMKTEVAQLHSCLRGQEQRGGGVAVSSGHLHSLQMHPSNSFNITRFRLRSLFTQVPTEIRQVLLVLFAHLFFHTIFSMMYPYSSSTLSTPSLPSINATSSPPSSSTSSVPSSSS